MTREKMIWELINSERMYKQALKDEHTWKEEEK